MEPEFKQIEKYPDYWINAQGTIKRAARTLSTKQGMRYRPERIIGRTGRPKGSEVILYKDGVGHCVSVSLCLLETFGPPKPNVYNVKLFAGHLDSNSYNIALDNLSWMTRQEISRNLILNRNKRC